MRDRSLVRAAQTLIVGRSVALVSRAVVRGIVVQYYGLDFGRLRRVVTYRAARSAWLPVTASESLAASYCSQSRGQKAVG